MKGILEFKSVKSGGVKDVDRKTRTVTGYASVFNNTDYDNDVIVKGAFTKSINERLNEIYFLYQHNWEKPIDKGSKNVKLHEDNYGLKFEAKIPEGLSYGDDLILLYEEGLVDQHSIGYSTIKSADERNKRILQEVKLFEFSAVTLAANPLAKLEGIKSNMAENSEMVGKIVKMLKHGNLTDDTFSILEIALKQLQLQSYELGKTENTQSNNEPSADTQMKAYEPLLNTLTSFKIN